MLRRSGISSFGCADRAVAALGLMINYYHGNAPHFGRLARTI
jgi:hypothetical protein